MTYDELLSHIRQRVVDAGSQGKLADEIGLAQGEISAVLTLNQKPGPKVLAALGLRKVVTYEPTR